MEGVKRFGNALKAALKIGPKRKSSMSKQQARQRAESLSFGTLLFVCGCVMLCGHHCNQKLSGAFSPNCGPSQRWYECLVLACTWQFGEYCNTHTTKSLHFETATLVELIQPICASAAVLCGVAFWLSTGFSGMAFEYIILGSLIGHFGRVVTCLVYGLNRTLLWLWLWLWLCLVTSSPPIHQSSDVTMCAVFAFGLSTHRSGRPRRWRQSKQAPAV